jgi:hypothetical protein
MTENEAINHTFQIMDYLIGMLDRPDCKKAQALMVQEKTSMRLRLENNNTLASR